MNILHYIHITDIDWDTDGEKIDSLPKSILIIANSDGYKRLYEDVCGISDMLSDNYGFCIRQFDAGEYLKDNPNLNEVFANTSEVLLAY